MRRSILVLAAAVMACSSVAYSGIFAYDISSGATTKLVDTNSRPDGVRTDGRYTVWREGFGPTDNLLSYDAVTGVTQQLTTTGYVGIPSLSNGKAVWQHNIYSGSWQSEIVHHDFATGAQSIIAPSPGYKIAPRMSGPRVVWHEDRDATGSTTGSFNKCSFCSFILTCLEQRCSVLF